MAKGLFKFGPGDIVKRPDRILPWGDDTLFNNYTWWQMKAKKITDQSTSGRGGTIAGGQEGTTFLFLSPKSVGETVSHTWSAYDSIASRVANKVKEAAKLGGEIASLTKGASKFNIKAITDTFSNATSNFGAAAESITRAAYQNVAGHNIPKVKVDQPLYYESSERRQLILEFDLIAESRRTVKEDVMDVVQDLMRYSAAGMDNRSDIDIEFPYYFEVKSMPGEGIKYTTAALVGVQPTWGEPWIAGFPSHCKLSLTFKDISPLFRKTITQGSIINVIGGSRTKESEARGELTANKAQAASNKEISSQQKQDSATSAGVQKSQQERERGR